MKKMKSIICVEEFRANVEEGMQEWLEKHPLSPGKEKRLRKKAQDNPVLIFFNITGHRGNF